jgi:hypothetical protein
VRAIGTRCMFESVNLEWADLSEGWFVDARAPARHDTEVGVRILRCAQNDKEADQDDNEGILYDARGQCCHS